MPGYNRVCGWSAVARRRDTENYYAAIRYYKLRAIEGKSPGDAAKEIAAAYPRMQGNSVDRIVRKYRDDALHFLEVRNDFANLDKADTPDLAKKAADEARVEKFRKLTSARAAAESNSPDKNRAN